MSFTGRKTVFPFESTDVRLLQGPALPDYGVQDVKQQKR